MAGGVNKVILVGRLGADPEVKFIADGKAVGRLSLATSESWTGKDGQKQEKTEWHKLVVWDKLAEIAQKHLRKGSQIYVEGKLQTRSWDDKETGAKKFTTEVTCSTIQFLDSKKDGQAAAVAQSNAPTAGRSAPQLSEPTFNSDEEIPF